MNLHGRLQIQTLNNVLLSLPTDDTHSDQEESPMAADPDVQETDHTKVKLPTAKDPNSTKMYSHQWATKTWNKQLKTLLEK